MTRVERYETLAPRLSAQLRPGVRTNAFASEEEYRREIAAGTLWMEETADSLLLLRDRGDFQRLNFYLHGDASLPAFEKTTVTEIACRPRDTGLIELAASLEARGWQAAFRRSRLSRPKDTEAEQGRVPVRVAGERDFDEALALFRSAFDPLTGCLPTEAELLEILRRGELLVADAPEGIAALLHFGAVKTGSELRHLATRADCRRRGAAQALVPLYMERTGGARSVVWVRQGNAAAEAFYRKNQYAPDGWTSTVLVWAHSAQKENKS